MSSTNAMKNSRWLALLLMILAGGLLAIGPASQPAAGTGQLPDGAESTKVAQLQQLAPEPAENTAIVLFTSSDPMTDAQMDGVRGVVKELGAGAGAEAEAGGETGAQAGGAPLIPNDDGTAAMTFTSVDADGLTENAGAVLDLREQLKNAAPEGVTVQVTGPAAVQADLSNVFANANFLLLAVTAAIVAVLLIVTYRSPVLWLLPLLVIGLADRVAATAFTWVLSAAGQQWNESTAGILSVLVFGAGTNYALLLISRYRDELHAHESRFTAMAAAWWPTVKAISASAVTVVLGVACLLLSSVPTTRGLGLAAAVGVLVALFFGALVLPGAFVLFGRWIFWPRRPRVGAVPTHSVWDRVGSVVRRRPVALVAGALLVLGVACVGATQMRTGLQQADQFIDTPESISASEDLEEAFPGQDATPATVMAPADEAAEVEERLGEALVGSGSGGGGSGDGSGGAGGSGAGVGAAGSDRIRPGQSVTVGEGQVPGVTAGEWVSYRVSGLDTAELRSAVEGTSSLVGGQDAELVDAEDYAAEDRQVIFPLVLALVFVALVVLLRAFLAPLIMVSTVLLTNVAALGIGWWISSGVFGFNAFADTTPLYAFVFLVALGVDYTIFLITRTREEVLRLQGNNDVEHCTVHGPEHSPEHSAVHGPEHGSPTRTAVLCALSSTGGVITSAGVLLAAVFAALGVLPLVALAQVGVVIFVGVLLDTLIVRTLLIPSVVQLLGERFWWPANPAQSTPGADEGA